MVDYTHLKLSANDRSYFSLIKKEIHQKALSLGISEKRTAELDIIVAEITSNIHKYSDHAEILLGCFNDLEHPYIEILSIDHGPGIQNVNRMLSDGISTGNTLGHGLGSIKRLSDEFDIYSVMGWGTILLSRIYKNFPIKQQSPIIIRPIVISKPGEQTSGDGFMVKYEKGYVKLMLADGLGHGVEANHAVNEAKKIFMDYASSDAIDTLRHIHNNTKKTRGMVANILLYDKANKLWTSTGIGNINVRLLSNQQVKTHMSYNGIVGHNIPNTMNSQTYDIDQYSHVIMTSDGIKTRWDLLKYPMILKHDPAILAASIYKDYARHTDDMSVIVIKQR